MEAVLLERRSDDLDLIGESGDYREARGYGITFVSEMSSSPLSPLPTSVVANFAYGFLLGMGSALETLCGQAFGAGQVHMLGVYMQRSAIILFATCILLAPRYIFATPILMLLGQPEQIAKPAGFFTMLTIPQMFALGVILPMQKFLQAQSIVNVIAWVSAVTLVGHVLWCWLFITVLGWGTTCAALACDVSSWLIAISQFVYVVGFCKDGWKGFSSDAFREIWAFLRLSFASTVMLCLEVWYMMSIIVLAGGLDDAITSVGALSICMNVDGLELMVFIGMNATISVRVSNELGLGRARAAKYSVYVTLFQSLVIGIVCMIAILATRNHFAVIYTDSPIMQQAVARLSGLLSITVLLNNIQPVISGVAIGGWQGVVAYINLACYYIVGVPLGYLLGYVGDMGVLGLWGGIIVGIGLQTLVLILLIYRTNWDKEDEQTSERMRKWGGQDIDVAMKPSANHL
ncbi:hypothetical protein SASPL_158142 [Salvia splendens]|uniref:Protein DETOXIFICATION n=1 Tax=Salvia splendens TaxID=180675 RepID=A0A8X8VTS1_SALSN|nr:hypothetical protein SASPL_158142 [Salvia splendens]